MTSEGLLNYAYTEQYDGVNISSSERSTMNTNIIKAVFFDYDGVLTLDQTGSLSICRYLSSITSIKLETVLTAYRSFNTDLLHGVKSHSDIWHEFCDLLGVGIEEEQLIEAFKSTPLNTKMIELAITLKSNGL